MSEFLLQTFKKEFSDPMERAVKYYSLLSVWNGLGLSEREVQLLAFTAIKGTISYRSSKQEFSRMFSSSVATVDNMVSKLHTVGLLVKVAGKYKVNEQINLDFERSIVLGFKLINSKNAE